MEIVLKNPLDMHLHLRDNEMLRVVAPLSSKTFVGGLIMPNLIPPITSKEDLLSYKKRILRVTREDNFNPYMTLFFKSTYTKEFLEDIRDDLVAIKLYPAGITTNSEGGVSGFDLDEIGDILDIMSSLKIPLCVHGETNGFVMDREAEFGAIYRLLASNFPDLKIIMEHITTKESVELLDRFDNLYATITLHHLLITLDDVVGGMLNPHLFCKPIAKRDKDRKALREVAFSAHPKVMFGSDSAPHPKDAKEAHFCSAGVFTAPIALQLLTELFLENSTIDNLQKFISINAQNIYENLEFIPKEVILEEREFTIPDAYLNVVPMFDGKKIKFSIKEIR